MTRDWPAIRGREARRRRCSGCRDIFSEQGGQLIRRPRSAEEVALHLGAAETANLAELFDGFDALGGGDHAELGAQAGHGPDDGRAIAFFADVLDETAIDLDFGDILVDKPKPSGSVSS
jgi:hypothetical protein